MIKVEADNSDLIKSSTLQNNQNIPEKENFWDSQIKGRLNRRAYLNIFFKMAFFILFLNVIMALYVEKSDSVFSMILGLLIYIIALCTTIIWIAVIIKRLHDLNKNGWLAFLILAPIVNIAFYLYLFFFRGTVGKNQYGPDPLRDLY